MKAVLPRTGSVPVLHLVCRTDSLKAALSRHDSITGAVFSGERSGSSSPRVSLHLEVNDNNNNGSNRPRGDAGIRRAFSESDVIGSRMSKLSGAGYLSFQPRIEEDDDVEEDDRLNLGRIWPQDGIPLEELGFNGGGGYKSGGFGGGGCGGGYGDNNSKMGDYYEEMLKSNPGDCLLLRNYAKYLHEVERDMVRAEEFYGRAILASPGDGELLSLYGKLIWESHRDETRAKSYFDRAVSASPNDCAVMGSYAHFMWEAEEDDEEEEQNDAINGDKVESTSVMVGAF